MARDCPVFYLGHLILLYACLYNYWFVVVLPCHAHIGIILITSLVVACDQGFVYNCMLTHLLLL